MIYKLSELKIEVTHQCNLQCVHCSSEAHVKSFIQISKEDCQKIIDEAIFLGVKEIIFSGGEPLLYKHIIEVVKHASRNDVSIALYTSGNVENFNEKIKKISNYNLKKIVFSIYGSSSNIHDKVTQKKNSFKSTLNAISSTIKAKIPTELHFVPLLYNYNELEAIAKLSKIIGINKISVLRLVPQGRGYKNKSLPLKKMDWLTLRNIIVKLRTEKYQIRTGSPLNFLCIDNINPCMAGIDRMTILPNLNIIPCDAFKGIIQKDFFINDKYSNLRNNSLGECWNHSLFLNKIRNINKDGKSMICSKCNNINKCGSGCMAQKLAYYGDFKKHIDPSCLFR